MDIWGVSEGYSLDGGNLVPVKAPQDVQYMMVQKNSTTRVRGSPSAHTKWKTFRPCFLWESLCT